MLGPWFLDLLGFLLRAFIIVGAFAAILVLSMRAARMNQRDGGILRVRRLDQEFRGLGDALRRSLLSPRDFKALLKSRDEPDDSRPTTFILDFDGDIVASDVERLRHEVTSIIEAHRQGDEVVLRLSSPGGQVHSYGLATSQLHRLRAHGIPLTVCVDKVAASGGYMMAVESDRIVAAPFAIIGSIGVVAEFPNVNRLLEKLGIDYHEVTAGEDKRTVTIAGEMTEAKRERLEQQLAEAHTLFREHVVNRRPNLDINAVSSGAYWYGQQALELGLIDGVATSDDVLGERAKLHSLLQVEYEPPADWRGVLKGPMSLVRRLF